MTLVEGQRGYYLITDLGYDVLAKLKSDDPNRDSTKETPALPPAR